MTKTAEPSVQIPLNSGWDLFTNNLIALLNLYEIIFVCIKSSLYEPCTDGGLKYNLSHLFHPQKNKFPFSCQ